LKLVKRILRIILLFFVGLFLISAIYILSAIVLGLTPVNKKYEQVEQGTRVFISSNGVHLDIVIPMTSAHIDWQTFIPANHYEIRYANSKFIGFGWGEKEFYINTPTWAELRYSIAAKAMLWPTDAAMHVSYYPRAPLLDKKTTEIILSEVEYQKLIDYILGSFILNDEGPNLIPGAGYSGWDNFYEAYGSYHLFYTSNEWINEALKVIGVRTAVWSPFDKGVLYQLGKVE
jgi:uncharacterized protein (TIGR02117 family)